MIQYQIKLRLNSTQVQQLEVWLLYLSSVWNWAVRKIELDARDGIYHPRRSFQNLLANHGPKLGIPSHTLQGVLCTAFDAWNRCWRKLADKPRLKGRRNKLNSIPFPDALPRLSNNCVNLPGLGSLRFHQQWIPDGKIKCGRLVKRASGWYMCLFVDVEPKAIPRVANGSIGIDPGYNNLLTLSTGEKINHPREFETSALRLAQAQRGGRKKLAARIQERISSQRKDRNHKLSRRLVSENTLIAFSADDHRAMARKFGKSMSSSAHGQLRSMLAYKSRAGGTTYVEPDAKNSTRACSTCGSLSGPSGLGGLTVRFWVCAGCGTAHDRDVNAAVNALRAGAGIAHEEVA